MDQFRKVLLLIAAITLATLLTGCTSQTKNTSPSDQSITPSDSTPQPDSETAEKKQLPQAAKAGAASTASDNGEDDELVGQDDEMDGEDDELVGQDDEMDEFEEEFEEATPTASDPFEGYNRAMTSFNDALFTYVLEPVGRGYAYVVPEAPRRGSGIFFHNLLYPLRLVNNLLQLKIQNAGEETLRFVTNTTIGIFGFWDPAKEWFGLEPHDEDFGQTLGFYGVGSGPHIVLPFFGPSNLRDTFSMYPDMYLDPVGQQEPIGQTDNYITEYGIRGFKAVNEASLRPGEYEALKNKSLDFYLLLRDGYEQMRNNQIEE